MEQPPDIDPGAGDTAGHTGLEREVPEGSVEYLLFLLGGPEADARATLSQLEALRRAALKLCSEVTGDDGYVWQRDEFNLELKNEEGLLFLHGTTDYGDAVEDEWLIVYLLRELTLSHPNLWVRVLDTDGEFLLVEAANVLPKWLSPETDRNRTWIHAGKLLIIPPSSAATAEEGRQQQHLSLPDAVAFVKAKPDELVHSVFVESEAFYRLEKYPAQVSASLHHSLLAVPRRLAHVLRALPRSVAPAVEAFYLRDAAALRPVLSPSAPLAFPPEDLVTVSVRFSRVLYAQLRSQRFEAPPRWHAALDNARREAPSSSSVPADADERARRAEAGMKLTCGFEMLSAKASQSKSRVVRELALTLEDLDEDGPGALPSDGDIRAWPGADRNDSEAWLDINYEDFERELEGGRRTGARPGNGGSSKPAGGFGDARQQEHLRKIVSRFEAFLNDDTAGLDGAQLEDMDVDDDDDDGDDDAWDSDEDSGAEDKEVSFDEDEFARMMREMMGLPSSSSPATTAATKTTVPPVKRPTERNQEDEAIRQLASQFEAELTSHGALTLDPPEQAGRAKIKGKGRDQGALKKVKEEGPNGKQKQKRSGNGDDDDDDGDKDDGDDDNDDDTDGEVNIDYNLAKNLLESFKSQGGMPGPTGNLLGMMGLQLPRDEDYGEDDDDDDEGQGQPGPSSKK
ncbi:hypothetical protein N3K66_003193 [Trichothecium roseum]|uniref:Uncharacterized protein n=1 Tax=Trichothecium roseum TaxID=47278 RepID=A0ACC0V4Q5_9HYPO|nr:hypothetical protein N3K66_003193 [Trichothecium roseum]